jgi:tRNA dimethylallyltransferase
MRAAGPWFIAGPTGVGKSAVALALADRVGGEIVSVDSMQVYRGMDIGTAKPSLAERARTRHHLIDVVDLKESFSAAEFVQRARGAVSDVESRGRVPILCGGTGLYFQAFLEGLRTAPPMDPAFRAELENRDLRDLVEELNRVDPTASQMIDCANRRRVVRALEIIRLTGEPISAQEGSWSRGKRARATRSGPAQAGGVFIGLERTRDDLVRRIDARVEAMFEKGLVDEVQTLLQRGLAENKTAMQALGYRQTVDYLRGVRSLAETVALVKLRTRQYAKRQMTWFRQQPSLKWVKVGETENAEEIVKALLRCRGEGKL